MAHTHLQQVITAAGLGADAVKAIMDLPEDAKDFSPDDHVSALRDNVATGLKNDPKFYEGINRDHLPKEFLKTLEGEQYGRAANIARSNILKNIGMKEEDFKDLGEEGKKLDVFIPAVIKKFTEGKITDKQLQEALQAANVKIQDLEKQIPDLEKKYEAEYGTKMAAFQNGQNVLATIAKIPGLKVSASLVGRTVQEQLASKYTLALVNGQTVLRQLDKPDLKVLVDNNTTELTLERAITEILTKEEAIDPKAAKKGTERESGKTKTDVDPDDQGGLKLSGHVNGRLQARLKQDEKAAGKNA